MVAAATQFDHVTIGALIKAHRENLGMSQTDVANALGYRNVNFISMIESGRSNIPSSRLWDVVNAYQLPADFLCVMVKRLQGDTWEMVKKMVGECGQILDAQNIDKADKKADALFLKYLKKFGLESMANLGR